MKKRVEVFTTDFSFPKKMKRKKIRVKTRRGKRKNRGENGYSPTGSAYSSSSSSSFCFLLSSHRPHNPIPFPASLVLFLRTSTFFSLTAAAHQQAGREHQSRGPVRCCFRPSLTPPAPLPQPSLATICGLSRAGCAPSGNTTFRVVVDAVIGSKVAATTIMAGKVGSLRVVTSPRRDSALAGEQGEDRKEGRKEGTVAGRERLQGRGEEGY